MLLQCYFSSLPAGSSSPNTFFGILGRQLRPRLQPGLLSTILMASLPAQWGMDFPEDSCDPEASLLTALYLTLPQQASWVLATLDQEHLTLNFFLFIYLLLFFFMWFR